MPNFETVIHKVFFEIRIPLLVKCEKAVSQVVEADIGYPMGDGIAEPAVNQPRPRLDFSPVFIQKGNQVRAGRAQIIQCGQPRQNTVALVAQPATHRPRIY